LDTDTVNKTSKTRLSKLVFNGRAAIEQEEDKERDTWSGQCMQLQEQVAHSENKKTIGFGHRDLTYLDRAPT